MASTAVLSGVAFWLLPEEALFPVHWAAPTQPDRFLPKLHGLLLLPSVLLGLLGLLTLHGGRHDSKSPPTSVEFAGLLHWMFGWFVLVSMASLAAVHGYAVLSALGRPKIWFPLVLCVAVVAWAAQMERTGQSRQDSVLLRMASVLTFGASPVATRRLLLALGTFMFALLLVLP